MSFADFKLVVPGSGLVIQQRHLTEDGSDYCEGIADQIRRVGVGHPANRDGYPVFKCRDCATEMFEH